MNILLIIAIICWFLAALPAPAPWNAYSVHVGWLGMVFAGISFIK